MFQKRVVGLISVYILFCIDLDTGQFLKKKIRIGLHAGHMREAFGLQ
jgi:hypothetical protein